MQSQSSQQPARLRMRLGPFFNTIIVAGGYMLSRVLGLVREVIISSQYGTRPELDAYRATFGILDLVYLVIAGGALGSAFIPIFSGLLEEKRTDDAWRFASSVLNLACVALLIACALIALCATPLVALTIGSGFDPAKQALTVSILRLLLIQPMLLGIAGLAKATLESFDRFTLPVVGANVYNLGIIVGALLAPWLGIDGLVWGVVVGAALFLIVQIPGLRIVGAHYTPMFGLRLPGVRQVGRLIGPRLFGQAAWQINLIALASFASLLGDGAVAANGYALQLMLLPHGLIALSLGTVIFPQLSRAYAANDIASTRQISLNAVRAVLFLALPASMLFGLLSAPLVRLLFERGRFTADSTALTAAALSYYALGLAAFAASEILVRTFYAMRDTRTPVLIGVVAVALNIALGWQLVHLHAGLPGLALAFSIANTVESVLLLALLRPCLGPLEAGFWRALGVMLLATAISGVVALTLRWASLDWLPSISVDHHYRWPLDFLPLALWLALVGSVSMLVYGGITALAGLGEVRATLSRFGRITARFRGIRNQ